MCFVSVCSLRQFYDYSRSVTVRERECTIWFSHPRIHSCPWINLNCRSWRTQYISFPNHNKLTNYKCSFFCKPISHFLFIPPHRRVWPTILIVLVGADFCIVYLVYPPRISSAGLFGITTIREQQGAKSERSNNCKLNDYSENFDKPQTVIFFTTDHKIYSTITSSCLFFFSLQMSKSVLIIYFSFSPQTHRELDGIADSERRRHGALHGTAETVSVGIVICRETGDGQWWTLNWVWVLLRSRFQERTM